jgi:hypothetical protein
VKSSTSFLREAEYQKFLQLKKSHNLDLSDYTEIWKTLILLLFCEQLSQHLSAPWFGSGKKAIQEIDTAITAFYESAFSPELVTALRIVEQSGIAAKLLGKHGPVQASVGVDFQNQSENSRYHFQTNLLFIRRKFEAALSKVKTDFGFLIFIDGIDIRPSSIDFSDYLDCIKGLANAVWYLNNDFFSEIKDSNGRFRTVLLVRPDIFVKLGLQNPNTKLRDNSVVLDWMTTYREHRNSKIFNVVDNLLNRQQEKEYTLGTCWDHYFPFDIKSVKDTFSTRNSFIWFLRNSLYRPRDIITYLSIFKKHTDIHKAKNSSYFPESMIQKREVINEYAECLLGAPRFFDVLSA